MITFRVLHFPGHCPPCQADYSNSDTFVLLSRTAPIKLCPIAGTNQKKKKKEFGLKLIGVILGKVHRHKEASPCKRCSHLFVMHSQLSEESMPSAMLNYLLPNTCWNLFILLWGWSCFRWLNKKLKNILRRWSAIFPDEFSLLQLFIQHYVMYSANLFPADPYTA